MGQQLIFLVEADKKTKSDWIYIKEVIDRFYRIDSRIKLSTIYMEGKGNYSSKESQIRALITQYKATDRNNVSHVICCFDCDEYDTNPEEADFLKKARAYCQDKKYVFVWFCKDIERVMVGKKVEKSQKGEMAATFKKKRLINNVDEEKLNQATYATNTSNIMLVLKQYLERN